MAIAAPLLAPAAEKGYTLIVPFGSETKTIENPGQYIRYLYQFGLGVSGLIAMAIIVFAAVEWTVSAGNAAKIADAKDRIYKAIIGIVLLFGAYLILNTISPRLTELSLPELKKARVEGEGLSGLDLAKHYASAFGPLLEKAEEDQQRAEEAGNKASQDLQKTLDDLSKKEVLTKEDRIKIAEIELARAKSDYDRKEALFRESLTRLKGALMYNLDAKSTNYIWEELRNGLNNLLTLDGAKADREKMANGVIAITAKLARMYLVESPNYISEGKQGLFNNLKQSGAVYPAGTAELNLIRTDGKLIYYFNPFYVNRHEKGIDIVIFIETSYITYDDTMTNALKARLDLETAEAKYKTLIESK